MSTKRAYPTFSVYVVECEVLDPEIDWTFYVGHTGLTLPKKWDRYVAAGDKVSRFFRDGQVRARSFRPDLTAGWGPYWTRPDAVRAEGDLALALSRAGLAVYSDRLPAALEAECQGGG